MLWDDHRSGFGPVAVSERINAWTRKEYAYANVLHQQMHMNFDMKLKCTFIIHISGLIVSVCQTKNMGV